MYTVCPKCALPLAVTAADLRAGQGYVRCGRCANVFNALLRLSEESALAAKDSNDLASTTDTEMEWASATMSRPALPEFPEPEPEPPIHVAEPEPPAEAIPPTAVAAEDPAFDDPEFDDPDITNPKIGMAPLNLLTPQTAARSPALWLVDTPPPAQPPFMGIEEPASEPAVERDEEFDFVDEEIENYRGTSTFETIVLEGDTYLQTEETIPEEVLASEIANVSRRIAEAHHTAEFAALMDGKFFKDEPETEAEPADELAALREATGEFKHQANVALVDDDPSTGFGAIKWSWGDWRLIAGAGVLALVFLLQALNHWRDDLATRTGWFAPMSGLSSMLGEPLHPNWDLSAYDLRQLGAAADSPDNQTLKVRLSLTNVGQRAQALPLIRLTLRDRFGKAVSRSEVAPAQYLPADEHGQLMIRRDQRIDTELRVLDPTRQVSSFELDVCVSAAGGGLRCAGDTPTLAARQS